MIDIKVKFNTSLTAFERVFSYPLREIATHLMVEIRKRAKMGQGPDGPFQPMGANSKKDKTRRLFWVPPDRPQPPGYLFRVGEKKPSPEAARRGSVRHKQRDPKWIGWAGYLNYYEYLKLGGQAGQPRDFEEDGDAWKAILIRVNGPHRIKVTYWGTHPKSVGDSERVTNRSVMYLASRYERKALLYPSKAEIIAAGRILFEHVDGTAIEAARIAGIGTDMRRKAASLQRRASRLLGD